ncbi:WecB/TagA/CpsF family glycosyltransferase [Jiella sp. MQZ9-1]|uniref:WecB/TagA/CpsF family glycosyltransferase n=1 Tax=Jiella flava TaxID=2816857 RepID=A0A939FVN4_9HYPH|nr:WecB/TagA/CpsF family glycosyltransferase [Jiella flava]MBO0661636.1 WecB/TagA/CpsF family glycosyltransferase [Jiella flava]MCD2470278.1 WecB/TagA/CpsF family glycosyltransferase [Jiella flava]
MLSEPARPVAAPAATGPSAPDSVTIAGLAIADITGAAAIAKVEHALSTRAPLKLGFVNAHCVNIARRDAAYRRALADFLLLPDGIGVDLGAKILRGEPFCENLNGTDFVPRLAAQLATPRRIALLGAAPGIAERAAAALSVLAPQHAIVAIGDGYFGEAGRPKVLATLASERPDIVLVAMGVPAQERFIADHLDTQHGTVFIAVGALFDFLAGNVQRAPQAIRRLRMEWAWRLGLEPKRLFRRYVLGNPQFLIEVGLDRLRPSRRHRP